LPTQDYSKQNEERIRGQGKGVLRKKIISRS